MSRRRVVITGMGTVNPLAGNVSDYWAGLLAGRSGIAPLTLLDPKEFRVTFGGEVKNFDPVVAAGISAREARRLDRFSQFALAATQQAVRDAGLDFAKEDPLRCGVVMGCGIGGLATFEQAYDEYRTGGPRKINLLVIPKMIANSAPGNISIHFGLMGINTSVATACASAGNAVGDAVRAIRYDEADVMISGGTEAAITPMGLGGFCSLRALSQRNDDPTHASRPFDIDRDGFVLSEGAGVVVLEEYERAKKRGAPIYAELLGTAATADAHHITAPHEEGKGAIAAMKNALRDARISLDQVDYVNAHGTSTDLGDAADVPNTARQARVRIAISNSFGFGGHNVCLVVGAV